MSSFLSTIREAYQVPLTDSITSSAADNEELRNNVKGKIFLFCGPPGCGKGTHCVRIADRLGCVHISTGDLFRAEVSQGTELGQMIAPMMESGQLISPDIVSSLLQKRLSMTDTAAGVLLDGFPRNIENLRDLDEILSPALKLKLGCAIYLNLTEEEAVSRLSGRRVCGACKATLHTSMITTPDKCPRCGEGPLNSRTDDREEVIRQRYQLAIDSYEPVVAELNRRHSLFNIVTGPASLDTITNGVIDVMSRPEHYKNEATIGASSTTPPHPKKRCIIS